MLIDVWIVQLEDYLRQERYAQGVADRYASVGRSFLAYLQKHDIEIDRACPADVQSYLSHQLHIYRQRHGRLPRNIIQWRCSFTGGIHLLLRLAQGGWPPDLIPEDKRGLFHRQVCNNYARWLADIRGLADSTIDTRCGYARHFLTWLADHGTEEQLQQLTVADIDAYLSARASKVHRRTCKSLATCLRSFLRYLHNQGLIIRDLSSVVTSPRYYTHETIPRALRQEDVDAVLETTRNDTSPKGLRDYAIILLLSIYGLRAGEVVNLRLEDVDWRHEYIHIRHSKTGMDSVLPLLAPVGNALLNYLLNGRPETEAHEIFIRARAPYRPLRAGASLYTNVKRRVQAAGVPSQGGQGPHAFRHAQAIRLLRQDVRLKTIGDILGHRAYSSTSTYLKLATDDLRSVGLEVPEDVIS